MVLPVGSQSELYEDQELGSSKEEPELSKNMMLKSIEDCMVKLEVEESVMAEILDLLEQVCIENTSERMI